MQRTRHITVELSVMPTEHGGRETGLFDGYRGQFYYDAVDSEASLILPEGQVVQPGERVTAGCCFRRPEVHLKNMNIGKAFLVREGNRAIAYGVIREVFSSQGN